MSIFLLDEDPQHAHVWRRDDLALPVADDYVRWLCLGCTAVRDVHTSIDRAALEQMFPRERFADNADLPPSAP